MNNRSNDLNRPARRSFIKQGLATAGSATLGAGVLASEVAAFGQQPANTITDGDAAVLSFAAAAELIETDLWQQYAELGGLTDGPQNPYQRALARLDDDAGQYITSNTLDEASHAAFLNAYLVSKGRPAVNLDRFRTLTE